MGFSAIRNFVDYEDVEPHVGPIKFTQDLIDLRYITLELPEAVQFSAVEH